MAKEMNSEERTKFENKVWMSVAIVALFVIVILLFQKVFNVLLLVLAGALVALYFHGLKGLIQRKTSLSSKLSMAISIIGTLILIVGFFWLAGHRISQQVAQLSETIPQTFEKIKQDLSQYPLGQKLIERTSSEGSSQKIMAFVNTFFRSTFGVLGDIYVILLLGIFFLVAPALYTKGIVKLTPKEARSGTENILNELGSTLKKWLKGKLLAMLVVAVLTAIGLFILGVPMALTLAVIAGLLNFIPNFGPLIAMIPAALIGLLQSPMTALIIIIMYNAIQLLEGSLITPQIQKKLTQIPPALIIIAQLIMGVLTGIWGLILATPLLAIIIVLVKELYVKKQDKKEVAA